MSIFVRRRDFDAGIAEVRADVRTVLGAVEDRAHHDEILAANVARVDGRIEAVHEQHAARMAAVQAELADVSRETVRAGIADLVGRLKIAEDGRQAQLDRADALAGEVEHLRAEVERLTIERDEARRQHDEQRAYASKGWQQAIENARVVCAARAVLPDLAVAIQHRPHGGSRTRARRRMEALATLIEPGETG